MSPPKALHDFSEIGSGRILVFRRWSLVIGVVSLYRDSLETCTNYSGSKSTHQRHIIRKPTAKLNESTKRLRSTSDFSSIINKPTGRNGSLSPNSVTMTKNTHLLGSPLSSVTTEYTLGKAENHVGMLKPKRLMYSR